MTNKKGDKTGDKGRQKGHKGDTSWLVIVSALSPFCLLCLRSCLPSCWSLCPPCLPSVSFCRPSWLLAILDICLPALSCCVRLGLAIPYICLPALGCCVRLPCSPLHVSPFCFLLVSLLVGHSVRLVSLLSFFVSGLVSLPLCPPCLLSVLSPFCLPSRFSAQSWIQM